MESFIAKIDNAVRSTDYESLFDVFSFGPSSWQSLGQGEQRSLASYLIKAVIGSPSFLPKAFTSSQMLNIFLESLKHLPATPVEGAADNRLRQMIFDYYVNEEGDYSAAANVLSGMRMDGDQGSVYYFSAAKKCDVYVKIAECFLEEDQIAESDAAVTKAGSVVESIENADQHHSLILRYKSTYARVLDSNRKFLQAASRYHDLSQSSTEVIRAEDLLTMLGRAVTCAILAPSGPQRQRVLGHISKDKKLRQLDSIPRFETHATILTKMYRQQILHNTELATFEASLRDHQKATMGDGLTILERGVVEHNMQAISCVYRSIYLDELAVVLGVHPKKAEKIVQTMFLDGELAGSIDQVEGFVSFDNASVAPNRAWDAGIASFCQELNAVTDACIRSD